MVTLELAGIVPAAPVQVTEIACTTADEYETVVEPDGEAEAEPLDSWQPVAFCEDHVSVTASPNSGLGLDVISEAVTAASPSPLKVTVAFPPLLLTVIVADEAPDAVGANVTEIVQLPPGGRLEPQLFVCPNDAAFEPLMAIPVIASVAFPWFVSVTVRTAALVATSCAENRSDVALKLATGAVVVPPLGSPPPPQALSTRSAATETGLCK